MSIHSFQDHDRFLRHFTVNEAALRGFVRAIVPTLADTDEVMQEVAVVLWQRFSELSDGEDFRRWAFGVAKLKVMSWRRDQARDRHHFREDLTNLLASQAEAMADREKMRREILNRCLERLPLRDRQLVESAYQPNFHAGTMASQAGKTVMSLYQQVHRIRLLLVNCTRGELAKEGWQ